MPQPIRTLKKRPAGEHYALLPEEILESDAWHWTAHFAKNVLCALASSYRGYNNGALELVESRAGELGVNRSELYAGLRVLCHVGLIKQTSPGRYRGGKGIPAKYALTFQPINENSRLGLVQGLKSTNDWAR